MAIETQAPGVAMVTLTIDGREVQVPKGTNLIEAARKLGIAIPYLCYHHQLTAFGGCRLCLVEVEKVPKLLAACNTPVAEGMVVRTAGEKIRQQRAFSLEFILLNHPLDCPICDKGGECELQDRVFEHGSALSRLNEPKIHIEDYDLGPLIVRNQDRCIICKRCIKVMEEVVGEPVLEFGQRGVTTEVYTFEHEAFAPGFSGNTIRVCPVGALMSKPFRFTARPWELIKTPGVCSLCSVGCNLRADVRENRLLRVVGLENPAVNDGWLCDRGQFGYDYVHSPDRLATPLLRSPAGSLEAVSWPEAIGHLAARLGPIRSEKASAFAALGSERLLNEDAYVLQQFCREVMASPNIDHRAPGSAAVSIQPPGPGTIKKLEAADVVLLIGTDLTADAPVLDLVLKRGLLTGRSRVILASSRRSALTRFASQWLQYRPGEEAALVAGLLQALADQNLLSTDAGPAHAAALKPAGETTAAETAARAGVGEDALREAARVFAGARLGSIVYGQRSAAASGGEQLVAGIRAFAALSGQAAREGHVTLEAVTEANTWGARLMGLLPDLGPFGAPVEKGLDTAGILRAAAEGQVRALWIAGCDPLSEYPDTALVESALARAELIVVQDQFLTATGKRAHVVLPATTVAERNGTLTNVEGRIQRTIRALTPLGAAREEWRVLQDLSEELGFPLGYAGPAEVGRAIRARMEATSPPSPAQVEFTVPEDPAAVDGFPLRLYTGRLMFSRGGLVGRSRVIPDLAPDPFVELSPSDAARLGLEDGAAVRVETPAGGLLLVLRVAGDALSGCAFVPLGYDASPAATLFAGGAATMPCRVRRSGGG